MTVRALWVVAVAMACVVVVGYGVRDRGAAPKLAPVLVAKRLIPAGSSGRVVVARGMTSVVTDVPAEVGAMPDPSYLMGLVASHDVFPGELVNMSDFSAASPQTPVKPAAGIANFATASAADGRLET